MKFVEEVVDGLDLLSSRYLDTYLPALVVLMGSVSRLLPILSREAPSRNFTLTLTDHFSLIRKAARQPRQPSNAESRQPQHLGLKVVPRQRRWKILEEDQALTRELDGA